MACFTAPLAQALVVTAAKSACKDRTAKSANPFVRRLGWLQKMLFGGSFLLAIEHVWHGEITWRYPFLTAVKDGNTADMLHEIATLGVEHHLQKLWADSINIVEYDPIRFPWVNHIWPRDHRKIVVIDGEIAYTGGMNVADYYIVGTEQVGEWRDMHCRLEGPVVNDLQTIFARIWKKATKEDLSGPKYYRGKPSGNKMVGIANREPHVTNTIMRRLYIQAIDDAQDSIRIINPYFTLIPSISKALKRAVKRGVKLEIMVSAKSPWLRCSSTRRICVP